ncbi:HAD-IIIA family hydrolase [Teredinibacter sp. KSP-S5-2]|uniref:HAD-IIIA family hydrolase n=1 Tax=Teredinibacter sp. KSP-S5-2 TaxID=3034506 RepID=UPI002934EBFA|nr:HAD-IIIA family hydrolase [Teredinibacter sp. KSP-S5-2]WNO07648.1 HAD-IIIA family hydrolase [Teredinibacter sp. KSP-S5-2]
MLFIFDWDGTISDSAAKIVRCMQSSAEDAKVEVLDDETIKNIIGLSLPKAVRTLYPNADQSKCDEIKEGYSSHFLSADTIPSPFFPGVMDTLEELKARGHKLAIATGKSRKGLNRVLNNLDMSEFFDSTRCADETASKPHPQMLNELLTEFEVSAAEAVMIGDTEYDMEMAMSIDMHRIAVSYGAHHVDRLKPYYPNMCIDRFDQLLSWDLSA